MEVQSMDKEEVAREKGIYRVTIVGSVVNFLLLLFKFFAGIMGHSAAMLADAVHSLSDFVTDIIVIVFVRISSKPEDEGHDYGHGKYETLATAIIGIILLGVGFGIFWNGASSIYRFLHGGSLQEPGMLALIAALVSVAFKEALYRYTVFKGKRLNSQAVVANAWHHRSDALSSIGSFIGILGARMGYGIMDPLASVVICLMSIHASIGIFRDASDKLVDHAANGRTIEEMKSFVMKQCGVTGIDSLRTRMFGAKMYVDIDIVADGNLTLFQAHRIADEVHDTIERHFPEVKHCMVHVSPDPEIAAKDNTKTNIFCPIGSNRITGES